MADTLTVTDNRTGKKYELPIQGGTIRAMDLRQIKTTADDFGLMTYDPAFMNTASCRSSITFIDGDKGILRYRGYPIEQLAEKASFLEVAYLLRNGELRQLTEDHSLVREQVRQGLISAEEAERSELSNVILRALGAEPTVLPDLDEVWVGAKDQILLCSDGLTRMVPDAQIAKVLDSNQTPQEAADGLVELANANGGEDNTTVIVARLLPPLTGWKRWMRIFRGGDRTCPS